MLNVTSCMWDHKRQKCDLDLFNIIVTLLFVHKNVFINTLKGAIYLITFSTYMDNKAFISTKTFFFLKAKDGFWKQNKMCNELQTI